MTGRGAPTAQTIAPASALTVPALFRCRLTHVRHGQVGHSFSYTVRLWLVDVDALPRLPRPLSAIASFDASDHLGSVGGATIRAKLNTYLASQQVVLDGGRILMLAQPRALGYAFDPVTFFYCFRVDSTAAYVVAEVHNTFGERHCYLIACDDAGNPDVPKELYVSPFFPTDGHYRMRFRLDGGSVQVAITLHRRPNTRSAVPAPALSAVLQGRCVSTPAHPAAALLRPSGLLAPRRTVLLIHWQALRLRILGLVPARRRYHQPQPGVDAPPEPTQESAHG